LPLAQLRPVKGILLGWVGRVNRHWSFVLASAFGALILMGLGLWQLQRLSEKQALLAELSTRAAKEPLTLSAALAEEEAGDIEFRKVEVIGAYLPAETKFMLETFDGMAGWRVITPLRARDGIFVLVDRGIIPESMRKTVLTPTGPVTLVGLVRRHDGKRGAFSPDNDDAANNWHWWDVPAMLAQSDISLELKIAPFVLQLVPTAGDRGFPRPEQPASALRNSHLQYAITWFALALVLVVIALVYVRGSPRKTGA
jgi:surfeit locus 1 family protein